MYNEYREINGFSLVNEEKLGRAIEGSPGKEGKATGGVGREASPEAVLAEYDRLGGLVLKGGRKIKTGSFYNFEERAPRAVPEVVYELRDLDGNKVELKEGEEVPVEVKAAEKRAKTKAAEETPEAEEAPKKKRKKVAEDEE